jgi:hypothetical protein
VDIKNIKGVEESCIIKYPLIVAVTIEQCTSIVIGKKKLSPNWEDCGPRPVFASYTLAFALQLRKNHGKTLDTVAT